MAVVKDPFYIRGEIVGYDRYHDEFEVGPWQKCWEAENIVLNGYYNDLFSVLAYDYLITPPLFPDIQMRALALGYKASPSFARTDTALQTEWNNPVTTTTSVIANGATVTSIAVSALAMAIPSGASIQLAAGDQPVLSSNAAVGATSIAVTSFVTTQAYGIGTTVTVLSWTPQRLSTTVATPTVADPPSMTWSFYLPAAANTANVTFTEAGMLYNNPPLTSGGGGAFATHVAFAYTKTPNTDLRLDYTLQRTLT